MKSSLLQSIYSSSSTTAHHHHPIQQQQQQQMPSKVSNSNESYHKNTNNSSLNKNKNAKQQQLSKSLLELSNKGYANEIDLPNQQNKREKAQKTHKGSVSNLYPMNDFVKANNNRITTTNCESTSTSYSAKSISEYDNGSSVVKSAFVKPVHTDDSKVQRKPLVLVAENQRVENTQSASSCAARDIDITVDVEGSIDDDNNGPERVDDKHPSQIKIEYDGDDDDDECSTVNDDCDEYEDRSTYSLSAHKPIEVVKKKSVSIEQLNAMQPPPHIQPLSGVLSKVSTMF
jgi:hypothetical protein